MEYCGGYNAISDGQKVFIQFTGFINHGQAAEGLCGMQAKAVEQNELTTGNVIR
jgi:hypothetical protein